VSYAIPRLFWHR